MDQMDQMVKHQRRHGQTSKKAWSASDWYFVIATPSIYSAGLITFTAPSHNLLTGDVVNVISNLPTSAFIKQNTSINVIDAATFTIAYPTDPGTIRYQEVLNIICGKYSEMMYRPAIVQVDILPVGTTIAIQQKIHIYADWMTVASVSSTDGDSQIVFDPIMNYVRAMITLGSGQPKLYSQGV